MSLPKLLRPEPASRHPIDPRALFVLVMALVSGLPLFFGVIEPGSIDEALPTWAVLAWAAALVVGAATSLTGMSMQTLLGVILEGVGSIAVGAATVFYGAVILLEVPFRSGAFPAAIILGWGLANFWRWGQLRAYLTRAEREGARAVAGERP